MNKSKHLTFRCTQPQYNAFKILADAKGTSISELLQNLVAEFIKRNENIYLPAEEAARLIARECTPLVINKQDKP